MSLLDRHDSTEPPAEEWPAEGVPADASPADELPADEVSGEWPADELPAEHWPVDASPADDLPADEPAVYAEPADAAHEDTQPAAPVAHAAPPAKRPLYPRLLHLQHIHPNAWQRALLGEGAVGLAGLLVLADLATAWTLIVLPLAVAAIVKCHDLLAGLLGDPGAGPADL